MTAIRILLIMQACKERKALCNLLRCKQVMLDICDNLHHALEQLNENNVTLLIIKKLPNTNLNQDFCLIVKNLYPTIKIVAIEEQASTNTKMLNVGEIDHYWHQPWLDKEVLNKVKALVNKKQPFSVTENIIITNYIGQIIKTNAPATKLKLANTINELLNNDEQLHTIRKALKKEAIWQNHCLLTINGETVTHWLTVFKITDEDSQARSFIFVFPSGEKNESQPFHYHTEIDRNTGVSNLQSFQTQLQLFIEEAELLQQPFALYIFTLACKRLLDDAEEFELLMRKITEKLRVTLPSDTVIARVEQYRLTILSSQQHHENMLEKMIEQCTKKAFRIANKEFDIQYQLDVCYYPQDGMDYRSLLTKVTNETLLEKE